MKREQKQRIVFVGLRLGQQKYFINEASHVVTGRFNRGDGNKIDLRSRIGTKCSNLENKSAFLSPSSRP